MRGAGKKKPKDSERPVPPDDDGLPAATGGSSGPAFESVSAATTAASQSLPTAAPFVGRSKELARLEEALARALAGEGRMVMLAGEPGIGKTRTAEELARKARALGAAVLWSGCYEGEGAPLYWPWTKILRELTSGQSPLRPRPVAMFLPLSSVEAALASSPTRRRGPDTAT